MPKNISSGAYKHKISIIKEVVTINDNGFEEIEHQEVFTPYAKVNTLFGREYWSALAIKEDDTINFTIRYRKGVDDTMFVKYNGVIYRIKSIDNPLFLNKELTLRCKVKQC